MAVLRLLRFLRSTVTFFVAGAFPEKLLNRCAHAHIPVWGTQPRADGLSAQTFANRYRTVAALSRRDGLRTRITKRDGLHFLMRPLWRRKGLWIGAICALGLFWMLAGRLWVITVSGCVTIDEAALLSELAQHGMRIGARLSSIDTRELSRQMLLTDDRISWLTVNLRGSTAEVLLSECEPPPETIDPDDRWANVVAAQDGVIHMITPYTGQALCKRGDTVAKGEVIVSGVMEGEFGDVHLAYARAQVLAGVYEETAVTVPYRERIVEEDPTPCPARGLFCFGVEILPAAVPADALRVERRTVRILYPFLTIEELTAYRPCETLVERTPFEAKEEAVRRLRIMQQQGDAPFTLLGEELTVIEGETALTLRAVQYVEKDIAEILEFSADGGQEGETVL